MRVTRTIRRPAVISPGDPCWDDARRAWNLAVDQQPAAITVARAADDVVAAVGFAREHGLRVTAQGTGHHAAPLGPLADTMLIRTHAMRGISIDPVGRTARVEAGALWQDLADAAAGYGLAGLAGPCPGIGVAGHVLGGGLSWLGRSYGLAANNVEAFELVTADGRLVRADAVSEPDLFWALRGGGGSFGVVTAIELRLFPVSEVYAGLLYWPAEAGRRVLHAWRKLTEEYPPDEFTTTIRYRNFPSIGQVPERLRGQPATVVGVAHLGSPREADELLDPLRKLGPLLDTMRVIPAAELGYLHGEPERPVPFAVDGTLLVGLPVDIAEQIVRLAGPDARSPLFSVEVRHLGAELGYARPGNGALPALAASHLLVATGTVPDQQAADAFRARAAALRSAVCRWAARRDYLNVTGASRDPALFWSPRAYDRLRRVKAAVDPGNMIRANHTIPRDLGRAPIPAADPDRRHMTTIHRRARQVPLTSAAPGRPVPTNQEDGMSIITRRGPADNPEVGTGRGQVAERGLFTRLGRSVTAHPVRVALGWVFIVAALTVISGALGQAPASSAEAGQLPAGYESARAQAAMDKTFGAPSSNATAVVVISRTDGRRLSARDLTAADHAAADLTGLAARRQATGQPARARPVTVQVSSVAQPSPNHEIALIPVSFDGQSGTQGTDQAVDNVRSDISHALAGSGLRAQVTGQAAADTDSAVTEGLATYGMLAAILILLLLLFRSPGLPFIVVATVFGVGTGVTSLLGIASHLFGFQIDQTTTSLLPVVLFGVGTDYAVFLLYRYRSRLRAGDDHRTAMATAIGKVGHAMVASALAVAVSFAAMLASGLTTFRILGPSLAIAVLAMLFTSLTLLPAMLALGSKRRARSKRWTAAHRGRVAGRVAGLVARWPAPVAAGAVAVLAALAVGALHYHASYDQQLYPSGSQSAAGYQELQRGYPAGALEPTQVIVTADHAAPAAAQLASFAAELRRVPGVGLVTVGRTAGHGRVTELDLQLSANPLSSTAFRTVHTIEALARTRAGAGTTALVGGDTAAYDDVSTVVGHDMKVIFALAGAAILLILLIMLRSLLAPLYLMASVVLGFAATLGASVVVFQAILGHQGIDFQLPMIVYLFVASIGTDYNILVISRLREEMRQGAAPRPATATAIRTAGPAVAAAGLVLSASFAMLMISPQLADIGFAVAAGVLISAFINAFLLVPALTALAGRAAWWPSGSGDASGSVSTAARRFL